jgi:hypothetical protein
MEKPSIMVDETVNTGYRDKYNNYIHDQDLVLFYPSNGEFVLTFVSLIEDYGYCLVYMEDGEKYIAYPICEQYPVTMVVINDYELN